MSSPLDILIISTANITFTYLFQNQTFQPPPVPQNYNERMSKTGRPVSPHVTIYQFPIAALTSIANRVTGVALSVGAAGIASVELINGSGSAMHLMQDIASAGPVVAGVAKFSVAFPLVYHYFGGMRHLAWDHFPDVTLSNIGVEKASYMLAGSSLVVSVGMAFV
jgi:succinate dehydrogenase (ubiquinone) cytochrome b560 subunit